jgi:hypothetical protein
MRNLAAVLVLLVCAVAVSVAVPYNSDSFGVNFPYISILDPINSTVEVTNPGAGFNTSVMFYDIFGKTIKGFNTQYLPSGKTRFIVPLSMHTGTIKMVVKYFDLPSPLMTNGMPNIGAANNDDFASFNCIVYLNAGLRQTEQGKVYKLNSKGEGFWRRP